jgi:hypothetical protein
MKFFKIYRGRRPENDPKERIYPDAYLAKGMAGFEYIANGRRSDDSDYLPEAKSISQYQILTNVPVFDYFVLKENYGSSRKKFDWITLHLYGFAVEHYTISGGCFLVSPQFREVVSQFRLPRHHFYPAKLMYKNEKLDYYISQLGEVLYVEYQLSDYYFKGESQVISAQELGIKSKADFEELDTLCYNKNKRLCIKEDYIFEQYYDYFSGFAGIGKLGRVVSERLKAALETAGITEGIEFKDINPRTIRFLEQE